MSHTASIPPTNPDRDARDLARLERCWPQVHVVSAEVVTHPTGRHAHAVVHLAGLAPADVRVELMRLPPGSALSVPHPDGLLRMWSTQSYENGCFVFEAALPAVETARGDWLIHVHAPAQLAVPAVTHRWSPE